MDFVEIFKTFGLIIAFPFFIYPAWFMFSLFYAVLQEYFTWLPDLPKAYDEPKNFRPKE